MPTDTEIVSPDQPTTFPATRVDALAAWAAFRPQLTGYDAARNHVRAGHAAVSRLSPAIRHRLLTEHELVADTLAHHRFGAVERFVQELLWRRYWKSWLELRPAVWADYRAEVSRQRDGLRGYQAKRLAEIEAGHGGVEIMDHFAAELRSTGYLHNHARMWFAGWWVHTERLPWALGADYFYRHLLDADPASNTLSWRWVAGIQTRGKPYLTRRSNLERYAAELVAQHPGGLDRLADDEQRAASVEMPDVPPPAWPAGTDDGGPGGPVGLWVHTDELSGEGAPPLSDLAVRGVYGGAVDDADASPVRQQYRRAALADGVTRAAEYHGVGSATGDVAGMADWATDLGVIDVVALRPAVGPVLDRVAAIREQLAGRGIGLHLMWRADDVRTLPWAESGYFNFWRDARADLLGEASDGTDAKRRKRLRRRGDDG